MGWQSETSSEQIELVASDTSPLARPPQAIWITSAGTVKWEDASRGETHTHSATLAAGFYPISIRKLWATGTTATVLGLYD